MGRSLSGFIIALILFSTVIVAGFGSFLASINTNYNPSGFNSSDIDEYNRLNQITEQVNNIENETRSLQSRSGVTDVLGGFFEAGYNAIKISYSSLGIFESMASQAKEDIPVLENINFFYVAITTIVIVILIFVILKMVTKTDV